jgi:hypothetical protein
VGVLTEPAAFEALRFEWDDLLDDSDQRVFFLRWAWNRLWWRTYGRRAGRLFLVYCRDQRNRLIGLAPFYVRQRRTAGIPHVKELVFLGTGIHVQTSEYLDIIVRSGYESLAAAEIARFLLNNDEWDRLWLRDIPSSSTVLDEFRRALGPEAKLSVSNRTYHIDVDADWDGFKQGLGQRTRANIGYNTRRLFKSDRCEFKLVDSLDGLNPSLDALVDLHGARWRMKGEAGSFTIPGFEPFVREAARFSAAEDRLRLWTLTINDRVAAAYLGFFDNGIIHGFQSGFDPAFASKSLGMVMLGLCVRWAIEQKSVREFDLMGGDERYKTLWTRDVRENLTLTLLRPGVRSQAYQTIERAKESGRSLLRSVIPAPVRRARHALLNRTIKPVHSIISREPDTSMN